MTNALVRLITSALMIAGLIFLPGIVDAVRMTFEQNVPHGVQVMLDPTPRGFAAYVLGLIVSYMLCGVMVGTFSVARKKGTGMEVVMAFAFGWLILTAAYAFLQPFPAALFLTMPDDPAPWVNVPPIESRFTVMAFLVGGLYVTTLALVISAIEGALEGFISPRSHRTSGDEPDGYAAELRGGTAR